VKKESGEKGAITPNNPAVVRNVGSSGGCIDTEDNGNHFATFPERLAAICIDAGCPPAGTVLDPFLGAGTVAVVAERMGRSCYGIEINPEYAQQARERIMKARVNSKSAKLLSRVKEIS